MKLQFPQYLHILTNKIYRWYRHYLYMKQVALVTINATSFLSVQQFEMIRQTGVEVV